MGRKRSVRRPLTPDRQAMIERFLRDGDPAAYLMSLDSNNYRLRGMNAYRAARAAGLTHEEIWSLCVEGLVDAAARFDISVVRQRGGLWHAAAPWTPVEADLDASFRTYAAYWMVCWVRRAAGRELRMPHTISGDYRWKPRSNYSVTKAAEAGKEFWDVIGVADTTDLDDLDRVMAIRDEVEKSLRFLSRRDADVLRMRFGMVPFERSHTLEEVAAALGVTRERVRQLQERGLNTITNQLRASCAELVDFSSARVYSDPSQRRCENCRHRIHTSKYALCIRCRRTETETVTE